MFSLIERHLATYIHVLFFDQIDHQSIFISIQIQGKHFWRKFLNRSIFQMHACCKYLQEWWMRTVGVAGEHQSTNQHTSLFSIP